MQLGSVNQEGVFHAFAQGADFGQQQVQLVVGINKRSAVEQANTVAGRAAQ